MSEVDLSALRMEGGEPPRTPRRPMRLGLLLLALVAIGVAATFLYPLLRTRRTVATAPVRIAGEAAVSRSHVAEAAGWIEPDPFPILVRPITDGVVERLLVLEGAELKADESVVATLRSAPHLAAIDRARAGVARAEAEEALAAAELETARALLEQRADLRAEEARARGERDVHRAQRDAAEAALAAAEAALEARAAEREAQRRLRESGGGSEVALARAEAAHREATATLEQRKREREAARSEFEKDEIVLAIVAGALADPRALAGAVRRAEADAKKAASEAELARTELSIAERELSWCEVRAPADGVVMKLLAAPGTAVGPDGEAVLAMYDPKRVQARIDVPFASVGAVNPGQEVEIRSDVAPGRVFRGSVIRVQREADILKNTIQVKVRIEEPDAILRPETLCRARFLGIAPAGGEAGAPRPAALFRIPRSAVRDGAVFVIDPTGGGRARRVAVEKAGEEGDDWLVKGDLSVTQRVILETVGEGEAVR